MTTETQPLPTDAELLAEWDRVSHIADAGQRRLACLRAVLAKWGTPPAVAGEVVDRADAVNLARNALGPYNFAITKKGVRVLAEAVLAMDAALTTPQPTQPPIECNTEELKKAYAFGWWSALEKQRETAQAGAVPLTHMDTKRLAWMADGWTPGHEALYVQHVLNTGGTGSLDDLRTFIDQRIALEAAHCIGIKGDQHV